MSKILKGITLLTQEISGWTFPFKNSATWSTASASTLLCVAGWTDYFRMGSDEVVLPLDAEKTISPTL